LARSLKKTEPFLGRDTKQGLTKRKETSFHGDFETITKPKPKMNQKLILKLLKILDLPKKERKKEADKIIEEQQREDRKAQEEATNKH
jgi:hypothetical protein